MSLVDEQFMKTCLEAGIYSFTWTLANYNQLADYKDMCEFVQSNKFILYNQLCDVKLYSSGHQLYKFKSDYISAVVHCEKISETLNAPAPVKAKGFFSLLTNSGQKHLETVTTIEITNLEYNWIIPNIIQKTKITASDSNILKDGSIKLHFELKVFFENTHVICNRRIGPSAEMMELINNMETLFFHPEFSDVKFIFVAEDGKELPAHKIILAFRVPFFQKIFQSHMKEKITNTVEITDIDFKVFKEMIRFIYTEKVESMGAVAADLIMAADKYGIDTLKNKCAKHLWKAMTIENVINIHEVAKLCNVDYLKNRALDFIKANFHKLIKVYSCETMAAISNDMCVDTMSGVNGNDQDMDEDESRSEATFRLSVNNFSKMKDVISSRSFFVRNLRWKIKVGPAQKSLVFFLNCDRENDSTSWSCYAIAKLKLMSCKEGQEPFSRNLKALFSSTRCNCGYRNFMTLHDILDPNKGYIKNDTITVEVHVIAGVPHGVSWGSKKPTGYVEGGPPV